MNANPKWKFWERGSEAGAEAEKEAAGELQRQRQYGAELAARCAELREELEVCRERLAAVYQRTPEVTEERERARKDLERLMTLAGLEEKNGLWQVVLSYADEHERTEREAALRPGLGDGERQYNAGRAASGYDFATALRELWWKAQREARKRKG